jgi:hypothetical protein
MAGRVNVAKVLEFFKHAIFYKHLITPTNLATWMVFVLPYGEKEGILLSSSFGATSYIGKIGSFKHPVVWRKG